MVQYRINNPQMGYNMDFLGFALWQVPPLPRLYLDGVKMNRQKGFSLIEIMVVVVILGILASIVVPKIMGRPDEARKVKAKQDVLAIQNALDLYKLDNGTYPTTDQGLAALVDKPNSNPIPNNWKQYLKSLPTDPWEEIIFI